MRLLKWDFEGVYIVSYNSNRITSFPDELWPLLADLFLHAQNILDSVKTPCFSHTHGHWVADLTKPSLSETTNQTKFREPHLHQENMTTHWMNQWQKLISDGSGNPNIAVFIHSDTLNGSKIIFKGLQTASWKVHTRF